MRHTIRLPGLLAHLTAAIASGGAYQPLPLIEEHRRGSSDKRDYLRCPSKYMPHQGKRERARRARRLAAGQ